MNVDTGEFRRLTEQAAEAEGCRRREQALISISVDVTLMHEQRLAALRDTIASLTEGRPDLERQARLAQLRVIKGEGQ